MGLMKDKYKMNLNQSKKSLQSAILSQNNQNYYQDVKDKELISDIMIQLYTAGVSSEYKIKSIIDEYQHDIVCYYNVNIKTNSNGTEYVTQSIYNQPMWVTTQGHQISPFKFDSCVAISTEEQIDFPVGTLKCSYDNSYIYYHPEYKKMWRPCTSRLSKFGFISMNLNSKNPDDVTLPDTRAFDQITPLSKITTIRSSKARRLFEADTFIKTIGEKIYDSSTNTYIISPITFVDEEIGVKKVRKFDYDTKTTCYETGYDLTDMILVLDIDCGVQIDYIIQSLNSMPYSPQVIISEKGVGKTKQGNSTALVSLSRPITSEERDIILRGYRLAMCFDHDVYAIDCHCSGQGYGKNPLKMHNNELQRGLKLHICDGSYLIPHNVDDLIKWSNDVIQLHGNKMSKFEDNFISSCEELKNCKHSLSTILQDIRLTEQQELHTFEKDINVFSNIVSKGNRNNTFCRMESSIYLMQYYLIHGVSAVYNSDTPSLLADIIFSDILQRYDNSDNQITLDWVRKRISWAINKDKADLAEPSRRLEFLHKLLYQKNICEKNNTCRLLSLQGLSIMNSPFKQIPEFKEIKSVSKYSKLQQQHGAEMQLIKGVMYAMSQLGEDIVNLKEYFLNNWNDLKLMNEDELCEVLPNTITDKKRQQTIIRVLCSWAGAVSYVSNNSKLAPKDPISRLNYKCEDELNYWQFSLMHNNEFIFNRDKTDTQTYIISNYILNICEQLFSYGMANSGCSFHEINKQLVKQFCAYMYKNYGANVSIVHYIVRCMTLEIVTPHRMHSELSAIHTQEICNTLISATLSCEGYSSDEIYDMLGKFSRSHDMYVGTNAREITQDILHRYTSKLCKSNKSVWHQWKKELIAHILNTLKSTLFDLEATECARIARIIFKNIQRYFHNISFSECNYENSLIEREVMRLFTKQNESFRESMNTSSSIRYYNLYEHKIA